MTSRSSSCSTATPPKRSAACGTKLADGATVIAQLVTGQPAAPPYGMLTDRFGITWIPGVTPAH